MVSGTAPAAGQQSAEGAADPSATAVTKAGLLTSKYTGVCWNKKNKRWQASINSGGKYLYLGSFQHEDEAARTFDLAAIKLRGTRAKTNFPLETYMDDDGKLIENEALNATIAVHEQLVVAQKLATAQALALAGVTKKPRAGAVGAAAAATAAKRLARANATNPTTTFEDINTESAAVYGSDRGSAAAAAAGIGLGQQSLGNNDNLQQAGGGVDLTFLQQAATAAASHAALATSENNQHQQQPQQLEQLQHQQLQSLQHQQMRRQQHWQQHYPRHQHQQQRGLDDIQSFAMQQQQQDQQQQPDQHEQQLRVQAVQLGHILQQPAGLTWQQQSPRSMHQAASAGVHMQQMAPDTLLPGVPLDGQELQQQKHQALQLEQQPNMAPASRTQQLAAPPGHLLDVSAGRAVTAGRQPQLQARVGVVPPPARAGRNTPSWQQHSAMQDIVLPAAAAAPTTAVHPQRSKDPAARHADKLAGRDVMRSSQATSTAPVIRLCDLSSHVPAGGQLLALVPGEGGLCGVVFSQPTPQGRIGWGTALWDGSVWHPGGTFGSEGSAASACQFAVTFAKQLAVSALTVAAADHQQQEHPSLQRQQATMHPQSPPLPNLVGNLGSSSAEASHSWQLTDPTNINSTSNRRSRGSTSVQQGVATTVDVILEQGNLDQLATAAGTLMEQQVCELQSQQPMQHPVLQKQQQQDQPQECASQQTASSGLNEQPNSSGLGAQQGLQPPGRFTYAPALDDPQRATPGFPSAVAVPTETTLHADVAASITLEMLVDLGLLPRPSAARLDPDLYHQQQQQQREPETSTACHQEPQQQHHISSTPGGLAGDPATVAADSSGALRSSQTSGISDLLVQLLQRVAGGDDLLASQQSLDFLGSLRCLMSSGSGSYESLLFSILGGSSGLEPNRYDSIPAMTSPVHTTGNEASSHNNVVLSSVGAGVSSPTAVVDDYGVFGSKGGMEAALLAAATTSSSTAVALGASLGAYCSGVVASPSQVPQSLSTTLVATPRPSNTASALQQTPSLSMHPVRATPWHNASGSLATQHGSELLAPSRAQSGTGFGNKQWASTLGAYLLSTKEVEQQQRESHSEEPQPKKRRCMNLEADSKVEANATLMERQQQVVEEDHETAQHENSV